MAPAEFIRNLQKDEILWFSAVLNLGQSHRQYRGSGFY